MKVAVDDAGAGFSTFKHILRLQPDLIKLDRSLIEDIDQDPGRRALVSAFIQFSRETASRVVAEGVETPEESAALERLGVHLVQGYLFGMPEPLVAGASVPALTRDGSGARVGTS